MLHFGLYELTKMSLTYGQSFEASSNCPVMAQGGICCNHRIVVLLALWCPEKIILGEIDGKSHLHGTLHLWTSWWQATQIICDGLFVAEKTSVPICLLTLSSLDIGVSGRKSLDGEDKNIPPVFWGIGDDEWSWFFSGKMLRGVGSVAWAMSYRRMCIGYECHGNAVGMFKVKTTFYLARGC